MLKSLLSETVGQRVAATLTPPPGLEFDYSQPVGEPALVAPDSVSWRVFKNPVSLFIGGIAAVILELAEPSVRAGVWDHSTFRAQPLLRMRRTAAAAMMTVYGPRSAAERMIAGVVRAHGRVKGVNHLGEPYEANDPKLLDWVQATASYGFVEAYSQFVAPLSDEEKSRAFREAQVSAHLYGATGAPGSLEAWRALLATFTPALEPSDVLEEFLTVMKAADLETGAPKALQDILIRAAFEIIPSDLRCKLGLEARRVSRFQRAAVKLAASAAERIPAQSAPPVQASIRLGLAPFYLYDRARTHRYCEVGPGLARPSSDEGRPSQS